MRFGSRLTWVTSTPFKAWTAALSASAGAGLVVAAALVPRWTYTDIDVEFPPLHATFKPTFTPGAIFAITTGMILWLTLPRLAGKLAWRWLLLVAFAGQLAWILALAMTEGTDGLARVFVRPQEYVFDAHRVDSIATMLRTFTERIPYSSPENWHVHVAGHPPGALLYFVILDRLGVTDPFWIGVVCVVIASSSVVAVMLSLKALGHAGTARAAMPWLVLAPSAVWMGVTGDAVFTAVAAWGLALLASAAVSRHVLPAIGAGLTLGLCLYLSYGLVLLGILAAAVLAIARSWRPLPWAAGGAVAVAAAFTAAGFVWWSAYPVLRERYYQGIASERHFAYWVWADIAAWTFTVGLAVWAAFPVAVKALRRPSGSEHAVVAQLAAAALLSIGLATMSGMSKAEVERIFLPFTIWVVALPILLPSRWHRPLLLSQVILALSVQTLLLTRW